MNRSFTFSQKLAAGFAVVVLFALAVAAVGVFALRDVVRMKDQVIDTAAQRLIDAERLHSLSTQKASESRAYLMSKDPRYLENLRGARQDLRRILDTLRREVETETGRRLVEEIATAEEGHEAALQAVITTSASQSIDAISGRLEREVRPRREHLDRVVDQFVAREEQLLREGRESSSEAARKAIGSVLVLSVLGALAAIVIAIVLSRTLGRQLARAATHVQSSSAELQAAAGEQATGAKQQATAMAEITTTITELLATSRQISESAQRVAAIAQETAGAARTGDQTVQRSQESIGGIRRQVDLIVNHMLELGRKSQQIGGILEVINELAEQTNILAINATIEAAGAGEAGKRFAVVAEEIRKLADRVGGSTKDIRSLIDEVRSAVNTTVMATESGSKAVESGARQFTEVAATFSQIARLVGTTTDASREIELSTKQQSTAVEQVSEAVANVAQATREAEASAGETLKTASQLAAMSRDLASLVQSTPDA